ncbi:hypothetical protein M378DRAFT_392803 [Amanita muscaria Koide BX008]|uniref:ABC transporter domain-containing protein n=1 Tax=Amanita muscaria (strain Koide BX008) TaxID=946122 RepID=A0A0C2WL09_AMAMK|nr:hypothetical protein M378DRAFT_392803 [Amanita muscaria Koide BX008]
MLVSHLTISNFRGTYVYNLWPNSSKQHFLFCIRHVFSQRCCFRHRHTARHHSRYRCKVRRREEGRCHQITRPHPLNISTRPAVRVLRAYSIEVQPGEYTSLVGASGSGKSMIIQLLERFYNPLMGEIYLNDELITSLNIQEYRQQIALVSQELTLYASTIRFNIPSSEVTQEEIKATCRDLVILEFIKSLPEYVMVERYSFGDVHVGRNPLQILQFLSVRNVTSSLPLPPHGNRYHSITCTFHFH